MASERQISVGGVQIGGGAPVVVQSMTLTKTHDVEATTAQIAALASAGCEIVRVAVPKTEDAEALGRIVRFSPIPVIADIHFNASLAPEGDRAACRAVRINPGNIGGSDKVAQVVRAAQRAGIPMRIGANSRFAAEASRRTGAAGPGRGARRGGARGGSPAREPRLPRVQDLRQVQPRADDDPAYRMLSEKVPYPLHLGVTEAGTPYSGSIKSAVGMGALLVDGIGDTMRVSLTADPVEEVKGRVRDPQVARSARARAR
jgi:(E)-4-hydroxy-3-methylbut-2-enyl-diphosphate synthase